MYTPRFRYGRVAVQYEAAEQPSVQAWVTDFVERSGLTGQLAFDFIVDGHGDAWALECNPRLTGGIHLFHGQPGVAGAFVGDPPDRPVRPDARPGRMVGAAMLLGGHLMTRAGRSAFARSTDILLDRRDPLPGVAQPLLLAALAARSVRTRGGLRAVGTHDIEWNGES